MAETAKLTTAYSCGKLQIIMTKKKKTNESAQEPCIIKIRILYYSQPNLTIRTSLHLKSVLTLNSNMKLTRKDV